MRPNSEIGLPFRRSRNSNASLSAFFASNPLTPLGKRASSPIVGLPRAATDPRAGEIFPRHSTVEEPNEYRNLIARSLAPHIAVLPSQDVEELVAAKGIAGGLLTLLRPFGESVLGKVTIRDSSGSSKSCEDYAVHFTKLNDGLQNPRGGGQEVKSRGAITNGYLEKLDVDASACLRTGGDVGLIEEAIEKHFVYSDLDVAGRGGDENGETAPSPLRSPFHLKYLRSLLSGLPSSPHETFSHPVACVIAISSKHRDPIEELRQLYASTRTGDDRLPEWASGEYLRYYVLIHDEENDDVQRSTMLFDQMKRHFGLHCHLLRLRSTQCVPSDDDCVRLPECEWLAAAEELSEIRRREELDDLEDIAGPCIYDTDSTAIKAMVRELVTQSVVPMMERLATTWNDQIVSRRRGISGRFLSLSKKWTPFGAASRNLSSPWGNSASSNSSNYDSIQGFYRPDTPEAIMRRLADYAFMLRDFKLALTTYDLLRTEYANDKAWKYHAGANEMTAITALMVSSPGMTTAPAASSKSFSRSSSASSATTTDNNIDTMLESATYSYITRCSTPFYALRALALSIELLHLRGDGSKGADDAARWCYRILEQDLVRSIGHGLFSERAAACYASRGGVGSLAFGSRRRKAALWSVLATGIWLNLEEPTQAGACLAEAFELYHVSIKDQDLAGLEHWDALRGFLLELKEAVEARGAPVEELIHFDSPQDDTAEGVEPLAEEVESFEDDSEKLEIARPRRKSTAASERSRFSVDAAHEPSRAEGSLPKKSEEKIDIRAHRRGQSIVGISTEPSAPPPTLNQDPLGTTSSISEREPTPGGRRSRDVSRASIGSNFE